jgi:DNA-binding transcriptional MerR regulator
VNATLTCDDAPATSAEVCEETGITYRRLDFWVRQGYLRPAGQTGTGHRRKWPESEVRVARHMSRLIDAGWTVAAAARIARAGEGRA